MSIDVGRRCPSNVVALMFQSPQPVVFCSDARLGNVSVAIAQLASDGVCVIAGCSGLAEMSRTSSVFQEPSVQVLDFIPNLATSVILALAHASLPGCRIDAVLADAETARTLAQSTGLDILSRFVRRDRLLTLEVLSSTGDEVSRQSLEGWLVDLRASIKASPVIDRDLSDQSEHGLP